MTSPVEAAPQYLLRLPGPGWSPLLAAVFTAAFFMLLTVKLVPAALVCGVLVLVFVNVWMWGSDPEPLPAVAIGGGVEIPTYATGALSHAIWATIVLLLVASALYLSFFFSYFYLWTVDPAAWTAAALVALPETGRPLVAALLLLAGAGASILAGTALAHGGRMIFVFLVTAAALGIAASLAFEIDAHWRAGLRPSDSGYAAIVYLAALLQAQFAVLLVLMAAFIAARRIAGRLDARRRVSYETFRLIAVYAAGQGLFSLLLVHGFPRLVS